MTKIFKYPLVRDNFQVLMLPIGAKILHANIQDHNNFYLWALVDTEKKVLQVRHIRIFEGGVDIHDIEHLNYINTFFEAGGKLVWHVFENKILTE